jgi:hypothetical protein
MIVLAALAGLGLFTSVYALGYIQDSRRADRQRRALDSMRWPE